MVKNMRRKIVNAKVTEVEKRRYPSKHYVYIIQVSWDDGSETVVFRRYSKFFDFQISLLESFPLEGGLKDPSKRIIPFLPGKILFRRSHVREIAIKRLKPIDEYCGCLVKLPAHISNSEQVLDFFESKPEDLHPPKEESAKARRKEEQDINEISGPILLEQYRAISEYTRAQPKELTIAAGQPLEVIEKHENGWWFVSDEEGERGWVPGVYLEKPDGQTENLVTKQAELGHGEKYITTSQFNGEKDEVSFGAGVLVEVLQKNLEGWWYISYQGKQGWAPASYLEKPAAAVLRQSSDNQLSVKKNTSENRRSFPGDIRNGVVPMIPTEPSRKNSTSIVRSQRKHLLLTKTNSNPSKLNIETVKQTISKPIPNQVKPPPKRSTLNSNAAVLKPQKPPPLPPAPKAESEPVYEYVTSASFNADIPHGISFEQDKKVKVIEKSPGDWWYITMDDKEGWAPASYVKKVFRKEKSKSPPSRPKLPSALKKTTPEKPLKETNKLMENKDCKALKTQLRKSPSPVSPKPIITNLKPVTNGASSKPTNPKPVTNGTSSKPTNTKPVTNGTSSKPTNTKPVTNGAQPKSANPKPSVVNNVPPKPINLKPATNSTQPKPVRATKSSHFDFKQVLNKNVASKINSQSEKQITSVKPFNKPPTTATNKAKLNNAPTSNASLPQKKPPTPAKGFKKPVIANKKPSTQTLETSNGPVDFRSLLKPASGASKTNRFKNNDNSNNKRPVVPGKPMLPAKPGKTAAGEKTSAIAANKEKFESRFKAKPTGKPPKPVLLPSQQKGILLNQNWNNNNGEEPSKTSSFVVNRAEIPVPNISFYNRRGAPDGQVDDVITNDLKSLDLKSNDVKTHSSAKQGCEADLGLKFIAVADFNSENKNEMGFSKGDSASLLQKSTNDWWYVEINGESGWVPCTYFEKQEKSVTEDNKSPSTKECMHLPSHSISQPNQPQSDEEDEPLYSEICENTSHCDSSNHRDDLYCAVCDFKASDDSTVSVGKGDKVQLVERVDEWCFVRIVASITKYVDEEGWLPSTYLEKC